MDKRWQMLANKNKALMLTKRQLSEYVYDALELEGLDFTRPEVQTFLDGAMLGKQKSSQHKPSDKQVAINLYEAWCALIKSVETDSFEVTAWQACELSMIMGKGKAAEWDEFRSNAVFIASTDDESPEYMALDHAFKCTVSEMKKIEDIYDQAIHLFLAIARAQLFDDVNGKIGRFMMNGWLLNHGYPVINLSVKYHLEFNRNMFAFYETGDQTEMNTFMRSCLSEQVINIMRV